MTVPESPLRKLQEQAEAEFIRFGPPPTTAPSTGASQPPGIDIVATYGEIEAEYASIRKSAGLMEHPQRAILHITGADRLDFLNRMVTNELRNNVTVGRSIHAFWLTRQGRILADMWIIILEDRLVVDLLAAIAAPTLDSLAKFVFTEDVHIEDVTAKFHRLALHGPRAAEFLAAAGAPDLADLAPGHTARASLNKHDILVERRDSVADLGLELLCPRDSVLAVHEQILEAGLPLGLRSIGWHAYNMARIEAGTPLFLVDFATDSLPHETGILRDTVSFTKGCYVGQEIVARMENLGHPSRILVGLRIDGDAVPSSASPVYDPGSNEVVGAVTSAAPSPMLGGAVIAFAVVKYNRSEPGTRLTVSADGRRSEAKTHPLRFWPPSSPPSAPPRPA